MVTFCLYFFLNKQILVSEPPYNYSTDWPETNMTGYKYNNSIKIAILDTGIDFSNPYLKKSNFKEIDISKSKKSDKIHGTMVAGIIAADGSDIKGLLPKIKLISITLGDNEGWDVEKLKEGIKIAIAFKVDIINISSGTIEDNKGLKNLIVEATKKNILVVSSAGNDNDDISEYPAAYPEVLSVGAIDKNQDITSHSNYGSKIIIYAPGDDILTIVKDNTSNTMKRFQGTSAAAPFVTSLAVLIKSKHPYASPSQIIKIISDTASVHNTKGKNIRIINFHKALQQ